MQAMIRVAATQLYHCRACCFHDMLTAFYAFSCHIASCVLEFASV